jgi:pimeloyl-ACP methyl ester carboxylesterase
VTAFARGAHAGPGRIEAVFRAASPAVLVVVLATLACAGAAARAAAADPALDAYASPARRVDIGGRRLDLRCVGDGEPTVMLDIGLGQSSLAWRKVQPALGRLTRTCSYDRAGFGFSDPGPLPRSASAEAQDLRKLVHAAGLRTPLVLVGHSLGSLIARLYANAHPGDVAAIVVIDYPSGDFADYAPEVAALQTRMYEDDLEHGPYRACERAARKGRLAGKSPQAQRCAAAVLPQSPEFGARLDATLRAIAAKPAFWQALISEKEAWRTRTPDALKRTQRSYGAMPLVILSADGSHAYLPDDMRRKVDAAWAEGYRRLAAASTRSEIVEVERSSHNMYDDRPDAIVAAVERVVQRLRGAR